jgi:hypothetical protein
MINQNSEQQSKFDLNLKALASNPNFNQSMQSTQVSNQLLSYQPQMSFKKTRDYEPTEFKPFFSERDNLGRLIGSSTKPKGLHRRNFSEICKF